MPGRLDNESLCLGAEIAGRAAKYAPWKYKRLSDVDHC
jgi:hypothetical protein